MVDSIGSVPFPVVFSDGESESEVGNVVIYPAMEFKWFLALLSRKIGISTNQFSVFISSPESRRRIPVTSKVNFAVLSRETNCFFLVVLKRSRRQRRRKNQYHLAEFQNGYSETASYCNQTKVNNNPLENAVFLRRGTGISHSAVSGFALPYSGRAEYENRVRELQLEKERFQLGLQGLGWGRVAASGLGLGQSGGNRGGSALVVCEECSKAGKMGVDVGFHWCAYDPVVTSGFKSPAGPISRPTR